MQALVQLRGKRVLHTPPQTYSPPRVPVAPTHKDQQRCGGAVVPVQQRRQAHRQAVAGAKRQRRQAQAQSASGETAVAEVALHHQQGAMSANVAQRRRMLALISGEQQRAHATSAVVCFERTGSARAHHVARGAAPAEASAMCD
jgi:hypothetical protein